MYATSNVFSSRLQFVALCVLFVLPGADLGENTKTVDQTKSAAWTNLTSLAFEAIALQRFHHAGEFVKRVFAKQNVGLLKLGC